MIAKSQGEDGSCRKYRGSPGNRFFLQFFCMVYGTLFSRFHRDVRGVWYLYNAVRYGAVACCDGSCSTSGCFSGSTVRTVYRAG